MADTGGNPAGSRPLRAVNTHNVLSDDGTHRTELVEPVLNHPSCAAYSGHPYGAVLAVVGAFGVTAASVARRTREVNTRMPLGESGARGSFSGGPSLSGEESECARNEEKTGSAGNRLQRGPLTLSQQWESPGARDPSPWGASTPRHRSTPGTVVAKALDGRDYWPLFQRPLRPTRAVTTARRAKSRTPCT